MIDLDGTDPKTALLFKVGRRVELHPATDAWMRGDRYGSITLIGDRYVHVLLERSNTIRRFLPRNINAVFVGL